MTVIVCRDGIMAADSAVWQGSIIIRHRKKISRLKSSGFLFAAAGEAGLVQSVLEWLNDEAPKPEPALQDQFGAIILLPDGGAIRIDWRLRTYTIKPQPFHIEGAHAELLFGALAAGATAEQAIRIAIQYGDNAGGTVQVEHI